MRKTKAVLACLVAFTLAVPGCYESLTDIATPDKLVFYEDVVGDYKAIDPATGRITIEKGKDKSYAYKQYDANDTLASQGKLWIIKLGEEHFYQITVDGFAATDGRTVYGIGRLKMEGKPGARKLTGYAFKSQETFFGDATVTTAEYEHMSGGERKTSRAVSLPADKLQAYLALRAAEMTEPVLKYQQAPSGR
ncbi:MAG TPA: hypothetical protein VFB66_17715 [Tepidisphaeraceae bacterium]|nr:hypothetical protein [Tepidisphaeraceae bacterium]